MVICVESLQFAGKDASACVYYGDEGFAAVKFACGSCQVPLESTDERLIDVTTSIS